MSDSGLYRAGRYEKAGRTEEDCRAVEKLWHFGVGRFVFMYSGASEGKPTCKNNKSAHGSTAQHTIPYARNKFTKRKKEKRGKGVVGGYCMDVDVDVCNMHFLCY